jgi:hypothetical protein
MKRPLIKRDSKNKYEINKIKGVRVDLNRNSVVMLGKSQQRHTKNHRKQGNIKPPDAPP